MKIVFATVYVMKIVFLQQCTENATTSLWVISVMYLKGDLSVWCDVTETLWLQFMERRKQMRLEGYSDKDSQDSYAFLCVESDAQVTMLVLLAPIGIWALRQLVCWHSLDTASVRQLVFSY